MKMKFVASLAFLFNTVLFGTYYAISKEVLGRIDPIIFTFFEMMTLVPAAICIIFCTRRQITKAILKRGILLGSSLCLALFTIAIALKYTTATGTAFFPSLNGFLAAFLAWLFLRHPITKATWVAGLLSVIGTVLLIFNSSLGGMRGMLIAFLGGLFFTGYVFLSDYEQKEERTPWALFGIELLTMAVWANLVVLLFGDWSNLHPDLPKDGLVIVYVAVACTFLPTLITVLMQKYTSPITISFIYIMEPIFGAIVAMFYLHEVLPLAGYVGGGLVVVGAIVHTWGSAGQNARTAQGGTTSVQVRPALWGALGSPVLLFAAGMLLLYRLHGLPTNSWGELYWAFAHTSSFIQQGQVNMAIVMIARPLCWLTAWSVLLIMVYHASYGAVVVWRTRPRVVAPPVEEKLVLDMRMLRQRGVTPYALASAKRREAHREKPQIRQRRRDRLERLMSVE